MSGVRPDFESSVQETLVIERGTASVYRYGEGLERSLAPCVQLTASSGNTATVVVVTEAAFRVAVDRYMLADDHLAALERVRVETLREAKRAVRRELGCSCEPNPRNGLHRSRCVLRLTAVAIDRLIDATTTPLTRCESCGHPREHHMDPPLGCYCRCTASDTPTTTGDTDA